MRYLCIKGDERIITYDFAVAVKLVKEGYAVYRELADEKCMENSLDPAEIST